MTDEDIVAVVNERIRRAIASGLSGEIKFTEEEILACGRYKMAKERN